MENGALKTNILKMKEQILTVEQMQELLALGIDTSNASMYYCGGSSAHYKLLPKTGKGKLHPGSIPTFTFYDITQKILPPTIFDDEFYPYDLIIKQCGIYYRNSNGTLKGYVKVHILDNDIMDCAFKMLKWCIEEGYITREKILNFPN